MRQHTILKGILILFSFFCLLESPKATLGEEMGEFKQENLAIKGIVIKVFSARLGKEKKIFLFISVKANALIHKEGEEKLPNNPFWLLRISKDKKRLFQGIKVGDNIVAYGIRKGKARILDVIERVRKMSEVKKRRLNK